MKLLDLFSGIGGFSLGLERAGMETIAFCEFDKHAQLVLKKHWPNVPIFDDVRTLDAKQFRGSVDVVCGGIPCQPFSVAGKQKGKSDERHLWPEMLRIIRECQPTWVIVENVSGFVNMALDDCWADLEAEGYEVQPFIIPACGVEAHHRRDRCWIVAYSESNGSKRNSGELSSQNEQQAPERQEERFCQSIDASGNTMGHSKHNGPLAATVAGIFDKASDNDTQGQNTTSEFEGASRPRDCDDVADTNEAQPQRGRLSGRVRSEHVRTWGAVKETKQTGSLNPDWVESLMGYPIGWTDLSISATQIDSEHPELQPGKMDERKD